ncbi:uncharacterized protein LOC143462331 [Clavelina lepadiformis]|uniref:uncharacterized protein LOC143462331 n=1 Tax=Clavelina lepadiformis TaxID=159417 RepID=UPI0040432F00
MTTNCTFCTLQNSDITSSSNIIVEGMQILITAILKKELYDSNKVTEYKKSLDELTVSLKNSETAQSNLTNDYKQLQTDYKAMKEKCDNYHQKFLEAQAGLTNLHDKERINRKNKASMDEVFTKRVSVSSNLFALPKQQEEKDEVIVDSDKFPVGFLNEDNCYESLHKPYNQSAALSSTCVANEQFTIGGVLGSTDLPKSCKNFVSVDQQDDHEFSIPASPVLSGPVKIRRKNVSNPQNFVKNYEKEANMKILKVLPLKRKEKKQATLNFPKLKDMNSDSDIEAKQEPTVKSRSPVESYLCRNIHKPISPIYEKHETFENHHELSLTTNVHDLQTSIDELFNKTDVFLLNMSSNATESVSNTDQPACDKENQLTCLGSCNVAKLNRYDGHCDKRHQANISPPSTTACMMNDSFDCVPQKDAEGVKCLSVVRKKEDRRKMQAKACPQCEEYYSDLPDTEREQAIRDVCRHRHQFIPPSTPENFWEIGIPSTAECKRRGYIIEEHDLASDDQEDLKESRNRRRRRKPYKAKFLTRIDNNNVMNDT